MMFSMKKLNNGLKKAGKTSPGKDQVSYLMLKNLSDRSKEVLFHFYNKV